MAVEWFSVNEDVMKDPVCTKVKEKNGKYKRERSDKRRDKPKRLAGPQPIWRMIYADDAGIVSKSRSSPGKMSAEIVAVCASFGLTVSEAKTDHVPDYDSYGQG